MKLILHIGAAKTGTTALQQALVESAAALQRQGVWVSESAGLGNARALPAALMNPGREDDFTRVHSLSTIAERRRFIRQTYKAFETEVEAAAKSGCSTFLVSSEHFQSRLVDKAEVQRCADWFQPLFDPVVVVVYLRRQDQAAVSRHSERLRAGWVDLEPLAELPALRAGEPPSVFFNYQRLLDRWSSAFGSPAIKVYPYDRSVMASQSITADFSVRQQLPRLSTVAVKSVRSALPALAQGSLYLFNRAVGEDRRFDPDISACREKLWHHLAELTSGRPLLPSRSDAIEFMRYFEGINEALLQWDGVPAEVGSCGNTGAASTGAFFGSDVSSYPEVPDAIDWEEAHALLYRALASLNNKSPVSGWVRDQLSGATAKRYSAPTDRLPGDGI